MIAPPLRPGMPSLVHSSRIGLHETRTSLLLAGLQAGTLAPVLLNGCERVEQRTG